MSWNISYDRYTASRAYSSIEKKRHLAGFDNAETALKNLSRMFADLQSQCEWWASKYESEAAHYAQLQEEYRKNPDNFSKEKAQKAMSKSPQELNEHAEALKRGRSACVSALQKISDIENNLRYAKDNAESESKIILKRISHAMEVMDKYLKAGI